MQKNETLLSNVEVHIPPGRAFQPSKNFPPLPILKKECLYSFFLAHRLPIRYFRKLSYI